MLEILPATGRLRDAALPLLYRHLPPGERERQLSELLAAARRGEVSLDGLLAAVHGGAVVGAISSSAPRR